MLHRNATLNHKIENYTYATAAARVAATGFVTGDLGKIAYQTDDGSYWRLTATTPTWVAITVGQKLESYTYATASARNAASGFVAGDLGKIAFQSDDNSYWRLTATTPTWVSIALPQKLEQYTYATAAARAAASGFVTGDLGKIAFQQDDFSYWRLTATTPTWQQVGVSHKIEAYTYANAAARTGASGFVTGDLGKIAFQSDDNSYWRLTATTPTWVQVGGGGGSTGTVEGFMEDSAGGQAVTTETVHSAVLLAQGRPASDIWAVKAKFYGKIKGGTTITFTPKLRWNAAGGATGDTIISGPAMVSGNNTADTFFELEYMVVFTGTPSSGFAQATMKVTEGFTDASGLIKVNLKNSLDTDVAITSGGQPNAADHFLCLTWTLSATTGSPSIQTTRGVYEFIPYEPSE